MRNGNCKEVIGKEARRKRWKKDWEGYLYMLPWLLGFLILTAWPMVYSFYLSFTNYSMFTAPEWVGLKSYIKTLIRDRGFSKTLLTMLRLVFMAVPLKLVFALLITTRLNKAVRGMNLHRTFVYPPSLSGGSVAIAALWRNIFGIDGYINTILGIFGIEAVKWSINSKYALTTIILLNVWQLGFSMIIPLADLRAIPNSLYETAGMDGVETVRKFFKVTSPMISPATSFSLMYGLIGAFQQFNSAFLVTKGDSTNATYLYTLMLYEKVSISYQTGYAVGMTWVLLGVVGCFMAVMPIGQKLRVLYED